MLEKYLKMLFSFNIKKNINILLIILVLLIMALLFFGNYNLVEGLKIGNNYCSSQDVSLVDSDRQSKLCKKLSAVTQSAVL